MDVTIILKIHLQQKQANIFHLSRFPMSTISSFRSIEGKYCMKKFCESFTEHAMEIFNSKKKMKLLTKEQQESNENAKICYIFKENFENKYLKDKIYHKVCDNCHYTGKFRGSRIAYEII